MYVKEGGGENIRVDEYPSAPGEDIAARKVLLGKEMCFRQYCRSVTLIVESCVGLNLYNYLILKQKICWHTSCILLGKAALH